MKKVFSVVTITPEVDRAFGLPLPEWIKLEEAKDKNRVSTLRLLLDVGEASSIALCLEHEAPLLIVDEKKGPYSQRIKYTYNWYFWRYYWKQKEWA